ncbi:MAG: Small GTP-binding domain protein [Promethearchaeota archaeon]|nr:MAG: Small GTP-binding domain protein [Candidatus Lokiarchaeota archaeon]
MKIYNNTKTNNKIEKTKKINMSSEIKSVINIFSKFLGKEYLDKKLKSIDEILNLPLHSYKFINKTQAQVLDDFFQISTIDDISKLDKETTLKDLLKEKKKNKKNKEDDIKQELDKQLTILKRFPDLDKKLKKTITISSLIKTYKEDKEATQGLLQKVVVVGLDNAGKTAILSRFGKRLGIKDLSSLEPTKGVNRLTFDTDTSKKTQILIWDFGGQEQYRQDYINNPEKYFIQTDLLIYVIDVQDPDRFDKSFEYFEDILKILETLEENPYILVFFHKVDPDLKGDSEILLSIEFLKDKVKELMEKEYQVDYEIYITSIYSLISNEPEFAKYIKKVMKTDYSLTDPRVKKVDEIARILEETMNMMIRLSESLSTQLNEIDARLRAIESGAFHIAQSGVPIEIQTDEKVKETGQGNARAEVLTELKDLFAKRKKLGI